MTPVSEISVLDATARTLNVLETTTHPQQRLQLSLALAAKGKAYADLTAADARAVPEGQAEAISMLDLVTRTIMVSKVNVDEGVVIEQSGPHGDTEAPSASGGASAVYEVRLGTADGRRNASECEDGSGDSPTDYQRIFGQLSQSRSTPLLQNYGVEYVTEPFRQRTRPGASR